MVNASRGVSISIVLRAPQVSISCHDGDAINLRNDGVKIKVRALASWRFEN